MYAEVLIVPDCPHQTGASSLLRTVLDELGFGDVPVNTTMIDTIQTAQQRGFVGSPTFLINGTDAFPAPGRPPAVACRLYPHPGRLDGLPDPAELRRAVLHAVQRTRGEPLRH
jgi:hypothetical protein